MRKLLVINGASQSSQSLPINEYVERDIITNRSISDIIVLKQCTYDNILCSIKDDKPSVIIARSLGAYRLIKILDSYSDFNPFFNSKLERVLLIDPKKPFKFSEIKTNSQIIKWRVISTYQKQNNPFKISGLRIKGVYNLKQINCDHSSINLTQATFNLIKYAVTVRLVDLFNV